MRPCHEHVDASVDGHQHDEVRASFLHHVVIKYVVEGHHRPQRRTQLPQHPTPNKTVPLQRRTGTRKRRCGSRCASGRDLQCGDVSKPPPRVLVRICGLVTVSHPLPIFDSGSVVLIEPQKHTCLAQHQHLVCFVARPTTYQRCSQFTEPLFTVFIHVRAHCCSSLLIYCVWCTDTRASSAVPSSLTGTSCVRQQEECSRSTREQHAVEPNSVREENKKRTRNRTLLVKLSCLSARTRCED